MTFTNISEPITAKNYKAQLTAMRSASNAAKVNYFKAIREAAQVLVASGLQKRAAVDEICELTGYKARNIYIILSGK